MSSSHSSCSTQPFFLEIFSEEIPAKMQAEAILHAKETFASLLEGVVHGSITVTCAPRRLCLTVEEVALSSEPVTIEKRGPRTTAPEAALQGFLRGNNVRKEDLVEKNGYFYLIEEQPGCPFLERIPELVRSFTRLMPWSKSMRWAHPETGRPTAPWVRPVHAVVCLWGNEPVAFTLEDWGLTTGNTTYGHRFLSNRPLTVTSHEQHAALLKENAVIADYEVRQQAIFKAIEEALVPRGLALKPDKALLDEVTGLVDKPFVVVGEIEERFMALPPEVLSTSMRVHQKYFATTRAGEEATGALAPFFVAVSNQPDGPSALQKRGFEKVLRARLSDALFFYEEDLKAPLESLAPKLEHIVFHAKLGTLAQKVERLAALVPSQERAARLCKLDLVTNMVGEFDELQGLMGTHYALKQGEAPEVALAIADHYRPLGQGGALPTVGAALAVADRLDSLVGFLGVGIRPTGSKDPFALRRAALGILRIVMEGPETSLRLSTLIEADRAAYARQGTPLKADVADDVTQFLYERLAVFGREQKGIRHDFVQAVLSFGRKQEDSLNLRNLGQRMEALQTFLPENGALRALFIRLKGILAGERFLQAVQEALFKDATESAFWTALKETQTAVKEALAQADYLKAMTSLAALKAPVDAMLTAVQIRGDDAAATRNRLALLTQALALFDGIADFEAISEEA